MKEQLLLNAVFTLTWTAPTLTGCLANQDHLLVFTWSHPGTGAREKDSDTCPSLTGCINSKQNPLVSSLYPQLQQLCSSSFKLHLEAELLLDGCFHAHLHWLFYQVNTGVFYLSILNILRDRVCDGMELSFSYENKYLRPQDNGEKILGDYIDDDDSLL